MKNSRLMAERGRAAALDAGGEDLRAEYRPRAEAVYAKDCDRRGGKRDERTAVGRGRGGRLSTAVRSSQFPPRRWQTLA